MAKMSIAEGAQRRDLAGESVEEFLIDEIAEREAKIKELKREILHINEFAAHLSSGHDWDGETQLCNICGWDGAV